jgi:integrase
MPKLKLTATTVKKLKAPDPSGKQVVHFDSELKGFGVLCSGVTNVKSYVVQRDVLGNTRRLTVGAVNEIPLDVARERAADMLDKLRRGIDPKQKSRSGTLRQTLEQYLASRTLREPTRRLYSIAVTRYLAPFADMQLSAITADMVEKRFQAIPKEVTRGDGRIAANVSMRVLRLLWSYAQERTPELKGDNPVRRLRRLWHSEPRRKGIVRPEDMPRFYAAIQAWSNPVARDLLVLLLFTGLRKSEASSLTWDDIDLQARVIHIPAARTKGRRDFDLPMSDVVADTLIARRALGDTKFVFPSNSKAGYIADPGHPLERIAEACGLKVSVHDMRRTFVTIAAQTPNITPSQLKALVNHSSGGDVTEGYVVFNVEALRVPVQLIADRIKTLCGIEPIKGVEKIRGRK